MTLQTLTKMQPNFCKDQKVEKVGEELADFAWVPKFSTTCFEA